MIQLKKNTVWTTCFSGGWVNEKQKQKDNRRSPRVSLKPAAMKHLCLPGSGKHTARHHSCKMSSGASSKAERLTLIHKQLPLSLCCRFRTAVPPNISLSCLANIEKKKEKKKDSTSAFPPQKQRQTQKQRRKRQAVANQKRRQKNKGEKEQRTKKHAIFSLLCEWNSRLAYQCFCEWKQGLSASARQSLGMAWSYPMRSQLDDSFRGGLQNSGRDHFNCRCTFCFLLTAL